MKNDQAALINASFRPLMENACIPQYSWNFSSRERRNVNPIFFLNVGISHFDLDNMKEAYRHVERFASLTGRALIKKCSNLLDGQAVIILHAKRCTYSEHFLLLSVYCVRSRLDSIDGA